MLKSAVLVFLWPGDSCCRTPQLLTPQVLSCPNRSAAGQICGKPVDVQQHHCYGCRYGGGVDRRYAAVARCLADVIHLHNGTKVFIEQAVPG